VTDLVQVARALLPTSAQLEAERGEVEGIVAVVEHQGRQRDWLRDGKINLIVQIRASAIAMPQVPSMSIPARTTQRQICTLCRWRRARHRPLALPGVPERTLMLLRQAFTQAMRDPALIEEKGKSGVDIDPCRC
jgi:hypothetical protein